MIYPMHGSCIENSTFSKYTDAIMKNDFGVHRHAARSKVGIYKLVRKGHNFVVQVCQKNRLNRLAES